MALSWTSRTISSEAAGSSNAVISLLMSVTLLSPPYLAWHTTLIWSISHYLLKLTVLWPTDFAFTPTAKLSWTDKQLMSEQWWQNCVQEKSSDLFLGRFVAGRPGRKQEVSVVVVGMGGEQKNWSRLKGKWACLPLAKYLLTTNRFICKHWNVKSYSGSDCMKNFQEKSAERECWMSWIKQTLIHPRPTSAGLNLMLKKTEVSEIFLVFHLKVRGASFVSHTGCQWGSDGWCQYCSKCPLPKVAELPVYLLPGYY